MLEDLEISVSKVDGGYVVRSRATMKRFGIGYPADGGRYPTDLVEHVRETRVQVGDLLVGLVIDHVKGAADDD